MIINEKYFNLLKDNKPVYVANKEFAKEIEFQVATHKLKVAIIPFENMFKIVNIDSLQQNKQFKYIFTSTSESFGKEYAKIYFYNDEKKYSCGTMTFELLNGRKGKYVIFNNIRFYMN